MADLPYVPHAVVQAIDAHYTRTDGDDETLRASGIGEECERRLWYAYRWAHDPETHEGRMTRLFATGDAEEDRLVGYLRDIGCDVQAVDPETGEQWRISLLDGRLRGSCDGIVTGVPTAEKTPHLLECKTHNERSFKELLKLGVEQAKPRHFVQMQVYMHGRGLTRALYLAKNKNTDELYAERVRYDAAAALAVLAKVERLVNASQPVERLHDDPNGKMAWGCRTCPALRLCHPGKVLTKKDTDPIEIEPDFARRNCRTCLHSEQGAGASWYCVRHKAALNAAEQAAGCPQHLYIPDLVPGEQIDADEDAETVTYRLIDGQEWVDGLQEEAGE